MSFSGCFSSAFTHIDYLVALGLQTLVDVNLSVPQQPHHAADQLLKRVGPVQNVLLRQIPGERHQDVTSPDRLPPLYVSTTINKATLQPEESKEGLNNGGILY